MSVPFVAPPRSPSLRGPGVALAASFEGAEALAAGVAGGGAPPNKDDAGFEAAGAGVPNSGAAGVGAVAVVAAGVPPNENEVAGFAAAAAGVAEGVAEAATPNKDVGG